MPVKTYSAIAEIYPHMMRSIDYKEWADYIHQISKEIKKKNPCKTKKLTSEAQSEIWDYHCGHDYFVYLRRHNRWRIISSN